MLTRPYIEDPECPDDNDLAFKQDWFETMKKQGLTVDDIKSVRVKEEYSAWLSEQKQLGESGMEEDDI